MGRRRPFNQFAALSLTPLNPRKLLMADSNIIDMNTAAPVALAGRSAGNSTHMRADLVEQASNIITDPPLLINVVSKRVRQLNMGRSPLIAVLPRMGAADIALQEIIEGKIVIENEEPVEA